MRSNLALRALATQSFFTSFFHSLSHTSPSSSAASLPRLFSINKIWRTSSSSLFSLTSSPLKILSLAIPSLVRSSALSLRALEPARALHFDKSLFCALTSSFYASFFSTQPRLCLLLLLLIFVSHFSVIFLRGMLSA